MLFASLRPTTTDTLSEQRFRIVREARGPAVCRCTAPGPRTGHGSQRRLAGPRRLVRPPAAPNLRTRRGSQGNARYGGVRRAAPGLRTGDDRTSWARCEPTSFISVPWLGCVRWWLRLTCRVASCRSAERRLGLRGEASRWRKRRRVRAGFVPSTTRTAGDRALRPGCYVRVRASPVGVHGSADERTSRG